MSRNTRRFNSRQPPIRRIPITLTGEGPATTWSEYLASPYPTAIRSERLAFALAALSRSQLGHNRIRSQNPSINAFSIGAALLKACSRTDDRTAEPIDSAPSASEIEIAVAESTRACGILDPDFSSADGTTPEGRNIIRGRHVGLVCAQHVTQQDWLSRWVRSRFLLGLAPLRPDDDCSLLQEVDELVRRRWGLPLSRVYLLIGCTVVAGGANGFLRESRLFENCQNAAALHQDVSVLLGRISCPASRVASTLTAEFGDLASLEARVYGFWQRYPAVSMGSGLHILGPRPIIGDILGVKLLLDLMEEAREVEGRAQTRLGSRLGGRFQSYVGAILSATGKHNEVRAEHEFEEKKNSRSPDHIVFERRDPSTVVLVQEKLRRFSRETFFGLGFAEVMSDVAGKCAEPIVQSIRYLFALDQAQKANRIREAFRHVSERVLSATTVVAMGVMPGLAPILEYSHVRAGVDVAIREQLRAEDSSTYDWFVEFERTRRFHWIDLEANDLEALAHRTAMRPLGQAVIEFLERVSSPPTPENSGLLPSFGDYVLQDGDRDGIYRPKLVRDEFARMCNEISLALFGRRASVDFERRLRAKPDA